nr:hypothetical protein HK105_008076 [Polyrhizophydium stewartii]
MTIRDLVAALPPDADADSPAARALFSALSVVPAGSAEALECVALLQDAMTAGHTDFFVEHAWETSVHVAGLVGGGTGSSSVDSDSAGSVLALRVWQAAGSLIDHLSVQGHPRDMALFACEHLAALTSEGWNSQDWFGIGLTAKLIEMRGFAGRLGLYMLESMSPDIGPDAITLECFGDELSSNAEKSQYNLLIEVAT